MSGYSDTESQLSSSEHFPIGQRDLPMIPTSGNQAEAGAQHQHDESSPDGNVKDGHASAHRSPHYSTSLSQVDQALLQLPPSERAHVNHLLADNGTLRARVKALTQELNDARDIFSRRGKMFLSRLSASDTTKGVQTRDVRGLAPLRVAKKHGGSIEDLDGPAKECQTDESYLEAMAPFVAASQGEALAQLERLQAEKEQRRAARKEGKTTVDAANTRTTPDGSSSPKPTSVGSPAPGGISDDAAPNQVLMLKAEIMKLKAEGASLRHSIELLRAGGATNQPQVQAAHSSTMQRVDELYRALIESIAKVSAAEAQLSEIKAQNHQSPSSASPIRRAGGAAPAPSQVMNRPVQYSKGSGTDRVLDMHVSSIPPPPHEAPSGATATSDYVQNIERALESTRAQLKAALQQLEEQARSGDSSISDRISVVSDRVLGADRRSVATSTGASVAARIEDLFGRYGTPFAPEVVEDLLKNKDAPLRVIELQQAAQQRSIDAGATTAMSTALATEVDALRNELLASHVAMDEMQYSLDLERRTGPAATERSSTSAAKDIAVLCDVVHASKSEIERLRDQVKEITKERNMAVNDFKQLQEHFRSALHTSERLVESQQDASDEASRRLVNQLRDKDNEIISLRAEISTLTRDIDKVKKHKEASQKDVLILRERTAQLQGSLVQLRSENTSQAQEIRQLRAHHNNGLVGASNNSNNNNSASRAAQQQQQQQSTNKGATSRRATTPVSGSGRNGGKAAPDSARTQQQQQQRHPQIASNHSFGSTSELEAQYEELRSCFLDLASLVTGDLQTARQVSEKVIKEFRALQSRVAHLEKDLRKRMATMESARFAVEEAKTKQLAAEQKARTLQSATKRATHNKKVAEDAAKQFDDKFDVMQASREELATKVEVLEAELEATRDALIATRNEVEVGRKLMLQLISDDESEMGNLVASTEKKLLASTSPSAFF